ncbi:MAG: tetratricopeptide repeat protein [Bacteroidia bacterium]|jgi:tetratricopeptide (TPR) repeat protein|nr:tetratricopeptide repeat protein [Bacteroidia bacterium]
MNTSSNQHQPAGSCIQPEEFTAYLSGQMDSSARHRIEMHLLDCDFCNDAMDGFLEMESPSGLTAINEELKAEVDLNIASTAGEDFTKEATVRVLFPWRMAAAVALIAVSTITLYLVIPRQSNQELFTQEYKPYPAAPEPSISANEPILPENEQLTNGQEKNSINEEIQKSDVKVVVATDAQSLAEAAKTPESVQNKYTFASDEVSNLNESDSEKDNSSGGTAEEVMSDASLAKAEKEVSAAVAAPASESIQLSETKSTAVRSKASSKKKAEDSGLENTFNQGLNYYKKEDYKTALTLFEKSIQHPEASFYAGSCMLSLENPHKAIGYFDNYIAGGNPKFREAAWWYKGLAYLKTDDKKKAKSALEQVITFKGEFEQQARELLRKL